MTDEDDEIRRLLALSPDELALELSRRAAIRRQIAINLGDAFAHGAAAYTKLARSAGRHDPKYIRTACGLCIKAIDAYQLAGLGRRAQIIERFMRVIHARESRRVGVE